ncbi:MAG: hypothetical protein ACLUQ0_10465 [Enterococcus italicus]|uniref:hypothetical protein n=1 Tax=Enterococcus italicus TaxID=246144 RepID=UPI003994A3D7
MNKKIFSLNLPLEIDLLFDNKKLDILKYLGILYQVQTKTKKRNLNLEQLLYYYTFLYYETSNTSTPLIYKYLRDKKRISESLIYLENLKFVQVHGNIFTRMNGLQVSITELGIQSIESWQSDSISLYLNNISNVLEKYSYGSKVSEFQKLLYEGEF